jgi:uncharacterized protein (TIGR03083 family)
VDHAAALVDETGRLADLVDADPTTPVPTCPGWTLLQLFRHVGRGHRWAATIVRTGEPADPRTVAGGRPPDGGIGAWLRESAQEVLDAVAEVGPDRSVWTFNGPEPAAWWFRRRLHESTVHRADAALALGRPYALAPALAADGLSEWLGLLADRRADEGPPGLDPGRTLHLHATDGAGEWLVHGGDPVINWEAVHGKGDAAVRGPARDLFLAAVRRLPADAVEVLGDPEVWTTWLARTHF